MFWIPLIVDAIFLRQFHLFGVFVSAAFAVVSDGLGVGDWEGWGLMSTAGSEITIGTLAEFVTRIPAGAVTSCPFSMNVSLIETTLTRPRPAASQNDIGVTAGEGGLEKARVPTTTAPARTRTNERGAMNPFMNALLSPVKVPYPDNLLKGDVIVLRSSQG